MTTFHPPHDYFFRMKTSRNPQKPWVLTTSPTFERHIILLTLMMFSLGGEGKVVKPVTTGPKAAETQGVRRDYFSRKTSHEVVEVVTVLLTHQQGFRITEPRLLNQQNFERN